MAAAAAEAGESSQVDERLQTAESSQTVGRFSIWDPSASVRTGEALFSTRLAQFPPRRIPDPPPPTIARSAPVLEAQTFAEHYQSRYPKLCRNILFDFRLEDWFDAYDLHLLGPQFCHIVLWNIATKNLMDMENFSEQWSDKNKFRLLTMGDPTMPEQVFSDDERYEYGNRFLDVALARMRHALFQLTQAQGRFPLSEDPFDEAAHKRKTGEHKQNLETAVPPTFSPIQNRPAVIEEGGSRSEAESTSDISCPLAGSTIARRSSFHGISAIPKNELSVRRSRDVVAEVSTAQVPSPPRQESSQNIREHVSRGHHVVSQPALSSAVPKAGNIAPTLEVSRFQNPERPIYQFTPRLAGRERVPSSSLRRQVIEGSEQSRGPPNFRSLNEAVLQQPAPPSQFLPTGQQSAPFSHSVGAQFIMPPGHTSHSALRSPPYAHGAPLFSPLGSHPVGQSPPQQMVSPPIQYAPVNHQGQRSYVYNRPASYGSGPLYPTTQSQGVRQGQAPGNWRGSQTFQEPGPNQIRRQAGDQLNSRIPQYPDHPNQLVARQENALPLYIRRTRSDSLEPFPPFYGPGLAEALQQPETYRAGQVNLNDFICTPRSIGRLREDVTSLWVSDFPEHVNEAILIDIFAPVARLRTVHLIDRKGFRYSRRRYAFVDFINATETRMALAAANNGSLSGRVHVEVRVPEQFHNTTHEKYVAPEAFASNYEPALNYESALGGAPPAFRHFEREPPNQQPLHLHQQGPHSSARRSSGIYHRRSSFGRRYRTTEQWSRDVSSAHYSPQDARSGYLHRVAPSEEGESTAEGGLEEQLHTASSGSSFGMKSSDSVTPGAKGKGRKGSASVAESPTISLGKEASISPCKKRKQIAQRATARASSTRELKSGVAMEAGAAPIVEVLVTIEEQIKPTPKAFPHRGQNVSAVDVPAEQSSEYVPVIASKIEEYRPIRARAKSLESVIQTAGSTSASSEKAAADATSDEMSRSSTEVKSPSQMTSVPELSYSVSTVTTAPMEIEIYHPIAKAEHSEPASTNLKKAKPSPIVTESSSQPSGPTETESQAATGEPETDPAEEMAKVSALGSTADPEESTIVEHVEFSSGQLKPSQEVRASSSNAPGQPSMSHAKGDMSTHKQGPAQTESLSPFGRKKPVNPQTRKSTKKKKPKGKGKAKEQTTASEETSTLAQPESSGGSRAVSSESYHTADEPPSDHNEEGKKDGTFHPLSENSTPSSRTISITGPSVPVEENQDDIPAMEHLESFDGGRDANSGPRSPVIPVAEQQPGHAKDDIPKVVLAAVTDDTTEDPGKSSKQKSTQTDSDQSAPPSPTAGESESRSLLMQSSHKDPESPSQPEQENIGEKPAHSEEKTSKPGSVTITAMQAHKPTSMSPSKRRPAPLELADITNVPSASVRSPGNETTLSTSTLSTQGNITVPEMGAAEMKTPTPKKKRHQKKKKRSSGASIAEQVEDSPASAEYATPLTSYPPLHQASSTTIVGFRSATTPKKLTSYDIKSPKSPISTQSHSSQKSAGIPEEQAKAEEQARNEDHAQHKQSVQGKGKAPAIFMATEEMAGEKEAMEEKNVTEEETKEKSFESAKADPWGDVSSSVHNVPFRAIQADDEAQKEAEFKSGAMKEEKGEEHSEEVTKEAGLEDGSKVVEETHTVKDVEIEEKKGTAEESKPKWSDIVKRETAM
ncbi:MAG: hypothetical protein M1822_005303 [Bathelium mastoideum]|nr:MAG: hypothetical protein M1822_005303 [Bathelium mastoideum]